MTEYFWQELTEKCRIMDIVKNVLVYTKQIKGKMQEENFMVVLITHNVSKLSIMKFRIRPYRYMNNQL